MIHLPNIRSQNALSRRAPLVKAEPDRDEYGFIVRLRLRRRWSALSTKEQQACLLAGAEYLECFAQQMREEARNLP